MDDAANDQRQDLEETDELEPPSNAGEAELFGAAHITLGAKQSLISFSDLEDSKAHQDFAFRNFRRRLITFLNNFLPANGMVVPNPNGVLLGAHETVCY